MSERHCNRCHKKQPVQTGTDRDGRYAEYCRRCGAMVYGQRDYGRDMP